MRKLRELSIKELLDAFEYRDNLADIRDELIKRRKEARRLPRRPGVRRREAAMNARPLLAAHPWDGRLQGLC